MSEGSRVVLEARCVSCAEKTLFSLLFILSIYKLSLSLTSVVLTPRVVTPGQRT